MTLERRSEMTSCAMERDGLASDSALEEEVAGLWIKEKRLRDSGVYDGIEGSASGLEK